jgi:hypothetical protein
MDGQFGSAMPDHRVRAVERCEQVVDGARPDAVHRPQRCGLDGGVRIGHRRTRSDVVTEMACDDRGPPPFGDPKDFIARGRIGRHVHEYD